MNIDLEISKELTKEAVQEKAERLVSLPMILQTLESQNSGNDRLIKLLTYIMSIEFEKTEKEIQKKIDKNKNPEEYKKSLMTNSRIFKENLKKVTKLMGKNFSIFQKFQPKNLTKK